MIILQPVNWDYDEIVNNQGSIRRFRSCPGRHKRRTIPVPTAEGMLRNKANLLLAMAETRGEEVLKKPCRVLLYGLQSCQ